MWGKKIYGFYILTLDFVRFCLKLGIWHEFMHPPPTLTPCHMLKVDTILYTIFLNKEVPIQHRQYELYAYNIIGDKWINTNVILSKDVFIPQLVSCLGRLFYVAFQDEGVSLYEIDLVKKKTIFLVEMVGETFEAMLPRASNYNYKMSRDIWSLYYPWVGIGANILALGCDQEYIVISSITQMVVGFDLANNLWIAWYQCRYMDEQELKIEQVGMLGCLMSISLNPSIIK